MLLLACTLGGDRDLRETRSALDAWERGVAQLEHGDATAARTSFASALSRDPGNPVLMAWEARAAARSGELLDAIAILDRALALQPDLGAARYNKAAYLARLEAPAEVVALELRRALEVDARSAREVLDDPDFTAYLDDPAFGFLPNEALTVRVEAPESTVFWGSDLTLRLRVIGAGDDPIAVTAEQVQGPLQLLTVVDDARMGVSGPERVLTWSWRVQGEGAARIGPLHAWAGARRATLDPIDVPLAAPPGKSPPPDAWAADMRTPSEVIARQTPPAARRAEGHLFVAYRPGDTVDLVPIPEGSVVTYEKREGGRTVWFVKRYLDPPPGVQVSIRRAGAPLFEQSL